VRIFQEVPLPPTCYLAEATLWVALGRVPQVLVKVSEFGNDYSEVDPRTNRDALDEDAEILSFDAGFTKSEFQNLGIDVDWERYERTKDFLSRTLPNLRKPTGAEVIAGYERQESYNEALGFKTEIAKILAKRDAVSAEADWVNSIDAQADAAVDIARIEVFRAVAAGQLKCVGWRHAPGDGPEDGAETPLVQIPPSHWSLRNFDWENSDLRHSSGNYYAVQVPTSDLLARFPRPQCEHQTKSLDVYPGCVLMEDDGTGSMLARPQRGRPAKGGGLIREAALNVFADRASRGELPEKGEALVQELIDFVALAFKTTISRSTAQQYIKMLPENAAG